MSKRLLRFRRRSSAQDFCLFGPDQPLGPDFIRRVSKAAGDAKVAERKWRVHLDPDTGEVLGYQVLADERPVKAPLESGPSNAGICAREMRLNAGLDGGSRTAAMTEEQKAARVARGRREMDAVEAVHRKLEYYRRVR